MLADARAMSTTKWPYTLAQIFWATLPLGILGVLLAVKVGKTRRKGQNEV